MFFINCSLFYSDFFFSFSNNAINVLYYFKWIDIKYNIDQHSYYRT